MKFKKSILLNNQERPPENRESIARVIRSFQKFGKDESEECKASTEMYTIHLRQIESGHIVKKEETTKEQRDDIAEKEQKIQGLLNDISEKNKEIRNIKEVLIKEKDSELRLKKQEKDNLEKTDPRDVIDPGPMYKPWLFYIAAFVSILLIGFIYYFYVNLGYVLFDLPTNFPPEIAFTCSPEVLNSYEQLVGEGGCSTSLSLGPLLLPILFLAVAILIHFKLENLVHQEGKKFKAYFGIGVFLMLVLVLDTILAIKFEERLFNWNGTGGPFGNQFPVGLLDQLKYSYKEPAFILIIGLGFVGYIIWSLITHEASKEYDKKNPENVWRRQLRRISRKINQIQGEKSYLLKKANHIIPDEIRNIEKNIANIKQSIKLIKIGGKDKLRKALIEFTIGWNQYIQFKYGSDAIAATKISTVKTELNSFIASSKVLKDMDEVASEEISTISLN
ncbi:MAG: hypothetical protein DWP94_04035 [Flavobacterium sp.]|nr:MAG: hypothetical protein DWP94_04035 [Flavobacterium sp.]